MGGDGKVNFGGCRTVVTFDGIRPSIEQPLETIQRQEFIAAKIRYKPRTESEARDLCRLINGQQALINSGKVHFGSRSVAAFVGIRPRKEQQFETIRRREFVDTKLGHKLCMESVARDLWRLINGHQAELFDDQSETVLAAVAQIVNFNCDLMPQIEKNQAVMRQSTDYIELLTGKSVSGADKVHFDDDGPLEKIFDDKSEFDLPFVCIDRRFFVGQWYVVVRRDPSEMYKQSLKLLANIRPVPFTYSVVMMEQERSQQFQKEVHQLKSVRDRVVTLLEARPGDELIAILQPFLLHFNDPHDIGIETWFETHDVAEYSGIQFAKQMVGVTNGVIRTREIDLLVDARKYFEAVEARERMVQQGP